MRSVAFKTRWFTVDLSVGTPAPPDPPAASPPDPPPQPGGLVVREDLPYLHVEARDVDATLEPFTKLAPRPAAGDGALAERVGEVVWYHTIELPGGVVTPGLYDHRPLVPHYGIPARLDGMRVLDIASWDGFWAFEFERRGAQVVSLDIPRLSACDLPPVARDALVARGLDRESTQGFRIAHEALGSAVERVAGSVYDLASMGLGTFDLVHAGDVLLHLESPTAALRQVRAVAGGRVILSDGFDPDLGTGCTARYLGGWPGVVWWIPSLDTLAQMVVDAGFEDVRLHAVYSLAEFDQPRGPWRACLHAG